MEADYRRAMIIHYTKYAEEKFFILQEHNCQILKEDINAIIKLPDTTDKRKDYIIASGTLRPHDEVWEVIYKKQDSVISVITFYPVKL